MIISGYWMPGERSPGGGSSIFGRISARSSIFSSKDVKCSVQLLDDSDTISNEFKVGHFRGLEKGKLS